MTYTTKTPKLFAKFFMEEDPENLQKALTLFEKAHGSAQTIDVIFVFDDGQSQRTATKDDSIYGSVLHYNFADFAPYKSWSKRELLIRVSPV